MENLENKEVLTIIKAEKGDIEGLRSVFSVLEYGASQADPEKGFLVTAPNIELLEKKHRES